MNRKKTFHLWAEAQFGPSPCSTNHYLNLKDSVIPDLEKQLATAREKVDEHRKYSDKISAARYAWNALAGFSK